MVILNPSTSNEVTVQVLSVSANTTLALTGPAQVNQGEAFTLTATLRRADTGAAVAGATLKLYTGATLLNTAVTNAAGQASWSLVNNYTGAYRYQAVFEGAEVAGLTLMPSQGLWTVGGVDIVPVLAVAALAYVLLRRR